MSDFTIKGPDGNKFDPNKRVRYSTGLVLGVDEFQQEQQFFLERDHLHQRGLHGYGVVCGLDVSIDGSKINVSPGLAVDRLGRSVRVDHTQCGDVQEWLDQQAGTVVSDKVYVTLCYRECETDSVPVPGAPCRSEDETVAPSRITSGFEIRFLENLPEQDFENAVRLFGAMLAAVRGRATTPGVPEIDIGTTVSGFRDEFLALRDHPGVPSEIVVRDTQFNELMAALLDLWVRDLKPRMNLASKYCGLPDAEEGCILLAELSVKDGAWSAFFGSRPLLLSTRLLQEYVRRRDTIVPAHADLKGLGADDHPHYLRRDGYRPMFGNLRFRVLEDVRDLKIMGLADGEAVGEALVWGQAAGGDLANAYPAPKVVAVMGLPVRYTSSRPNGSVMVLSGGAATREWAVRKLTQSDLADKPQLALDELTDVTTAGAADGRLLGFMSGEWVPVEPPVQALDDLSDVATAAVANGQLLGYQDGTWMPMSPPDTGARVLNDLDDCDTAGAAEGYHLAYVGGQWRPVLPPAMSAAPQRLDDLIDCQTPAPAAGQLLGWNGTHWVPVAPPVGGGGGGAPLPPGDRSNDLLIWNGSDWKPTPLRTVELANIEYVADLDGALLFEVWFHVDMPTNRIEVSRLYPHMIEVLFESNDPAVDHLVPAPVTDIQPLMINAIPTRNVFLVKVEYPRDKQGKVFMSPYCRFRFRAGEIGVRKGGDAEIELAGYAAKRGLIFEGQAPDGTEVNQFVRIVPNNRAGTTEGEIRKDGAAPTVTHDGGPTTYTYTPDGGATYVADTPTYVYNPYRVGLVVDKGGAFVDGMYTFDPKLPGDGV